MPPDRYFGFIDIVAFLGFLFCAVIGPELVSRDLRSGVLPLYFSRPLTRSDYAMAKWGAMVSALWKRPTSPLMRSVMIPSR